MASKTLSDGRKVLVGSKADPDSKKYLGASGGKSVVLKDGTQLNAEQSKAYGTTPTVITNDTIISTDIPRMKGKVDEMNKRLGLGAQSQAQTQTEEADMDLSITGSSKEPEDPYTKQMMDLLSKQSRLLDNNERSQIDSITQRYKGLQAEQRSINEANTAGVRGALLSGGGGAGGQFRYSPGGAFGGVAGEATAGVRALTDLLDRESAAISDVQNARQQEDFRLLDQKLTLLDDIRKERSAATAAASEALKVAEEKSFTDNAVMSEIAKGNTNPATIFSALGGQVPFDAIVSITKNLPSQDPFTLSSGQTRYDAAGNVIAQGSKVGGAGGVSAGVGGTGLSTTGRPLPNINDPAVFAEVQSILSNLPTKLRDSDKDREIITSGVLGLMAQGMSRNNIIDVFNGFKVENPTPLSEGLRMYMATGNFPADQFAETARLLNSGKDSSAITKVENSLLGEVDNNLAKAQGTISVMKQADKALQLLNEVDPSYLGPFDGRTFPIRKGIFRVEDPAKIQKAQQFASAVTAMIQEFRRENLGTAATENEAKFLEPLMASLTDQPDIAKTKLEEFREQMLLLHNSARQQVGLPVVNKDQLLDVNARLPLYTTNGLGKEGFYDSVSNTDLLGDILGNEGSVPSSYQNNTDFWSNF